MLKTWLSSLVFLTAAIAFGGSVSELQYTEAVVAYQKAQYDETLRLLENVLKEAPENFQALELKGLVLKDQGKTEGALAVFNQLRELAIKERIPAGQAATYDFQSGVMLIELKRPSEAKPLLLNSVRANFNTTPSQYFLGLISYSEDHLTEAENYFRAVARGNALMLRASAYYYMGLISKKKDADREAVLFWQEAKKVATAILNAPDQSASAVSTAQALIKSIEGTIRNPSDIKVQSNLFANVMALTSYDSNVLLNAIVNIGASGNPTVMETVRYGVGYGTQIGDNNLTTTLRGSINYNFNPAAHAGQFVINDLSLTYTAKPKSSFAYGMRTGALYILRNDTAQSATGALKPQSLGIPLAPFLRRSWTNILWTAELSFTPQRFFTDANLDPSLAKTGFEWHFRNQVQYISGSRFFNPSFDLDLLVLKTNGTEYRNEGLVIGVGNAFLFSKASTLVLRATAGYQEYRDRPTGARYDTPLSIGGQFDYRIWNGMHFVSEINFVDNLSNITDIYRYVRLVAGVGIDYRF